MRNRIARGLRPPPVLGFRRHRATAQMAPLRRARRSRNAPRRLTRRRTVRIILLFVAGLCGLGVAGVAAVYATYQSYRNALPDAQALREMEPAIDSHVYDRTGQLIAIIHGDERHEHIALNQVSRWARLATVDVEDRRFYEHGSWDLQRIVKAGWDNLRHNYDTAQGASTITEQLAKVSFLGFGERSFERKAKQVILGVEIENNFSKDQILEMYLNRIDYGNHSLGIESAAQTYFHKSAHDLDLAEAAMLAGLPNSPSRLNPLEHGPTESVNPLAKQRQQLVLQAMVSNNDITLEQSTAAYAEPLIFHPYTDSEPPHTNFTDYVGEYLVSRFGAGFLDHGGWEVTTSLDPVKQAQAIKAVHDGVQAVYKLNAHDGALVSMDPKTGEVLAMVGSWDPSDPEVGQINAATSRLQPGSTIKLFTYTAAIASRLFTMRTPVLDAPIALKIPGQANYSPKNYDHRYHGVCIVQMCLGNSYNVPAVKVENKIGVPYITDLEIAAGLHSLADTGGNSARYPENNRPGPYSYAATLGGLRYGITPLELADGVSTIASLGIHHDPAPVLKITERSTGKVIYAHDAAVEGERVVPQNVAFIITEITSNDHNRASAFGAHGMLTMGDRRISAKTGTTDSFVSNWTVGWTPDLVSVVWVGNTEPSCLRAEDRDALAAALRRRGPAGATPDDPWGPRDLAAYGLQPRDHHCGPLEGSTGITGAAPIWHNFMATALAGTPKNWYQRPADVLAEGSGDDAYFYLPGTAPGTTDLSCSYYGPAPEPGNPCTYLGTSPVVPKPSPSPGVSPAPSGAPTGPPLPIPTPAV